MAICMDYIKSGEVLIAPRLDYKYQYLLKCTECEECYCLLEPFIDHCTSHYNREACIEDNLTEDKESHANECQTNESEIKERIISIEPVMDAEELLSFASSERGYESNDDVEISETLFNEFMEKEEMFDDGNELSWECEKSDNNQDTTAAENSHAELIQKFMTSSDNVAALIDAYESQPMLWNNKLYSKQIQNRDERLKCIQEIINEIQKELNMEITAEEASAVIAHLRLLYRIKIERDKSNIKSHEAEKNAWFYERLRFLESFLESHAIAVLDTHPFDLTHEEIIQMLNIYEKHPHLWNSEILESCCKNKRSEAFAQMMKDIELEMQVQVDERALKRYLYDLHNSFSRQKRRNLGILHTKEPRFEYYETAVFLYDHLGPFKCNSCRRIFMSPLHIKAHKYQHEGVPGLHCPQCKKGFKAVDPYIAHVRRHMNDLGVQCKECNRRFLRKADLRVHMRSHTGVKPFCCEVCGMSFRHVQSFNVHKRRHVKEYSHVCTVCKKGCYTKHELSNHMRIHRDIRDFACDICGKAFKTKKTMQQHMFIHEEGRNHICHLCRKGFKNKIGLGHHLKTHSVSNRVSGLK